MHMRFKRILVSALMLSILIMECKSIFVAADVPFRLYDEKQAMEVVGKVVEAADSLDWDSFTQYMCNDEQKYYEYYFANEELQDGIKQIQGMKLINTYAVDRNTAKNEWLVDEYPILEHSNEIYTFIVETECIVSKENQFFFDGINYFLVVIAVEDGMLKIVQFNRPSAELLQEIVASELSVDDEEYSAELAGIEVIKTAEQGRVINASQEELTDGFEVVQLEQEFGIATFAADPPVISHYATYHYPTKIKVLLDKTGKDDGTEVVEVGIVDYMKNVLPNEWIPSWKEEALLAGAYCVKMVAIYRTLKPMSSTGGYHLSQSTQYYKPGSNLYESTSVAIDAIYNAGMADTYGLLFFPRYEAGTSGEAGTKGSGYVKQRGTQYLAKQGYTYQQILNYYYSGSDYSSGDLKFFSYNIGF